MTNTAHRTGNGHRIGYARVSTADQSTQGQIEALEQAGCTRIFTDHVSGSHRSRPELQKMLGYLREDDTVVVWRLDRLGRSMQHLVEVVTTLGDQGVQFLSLTEAIDTNTPTGRLVFHITASFSQFERDLISERTNLGLAAARAQGRVGGRPPVMDKRKTQAAASMHKNGMSMSAIATTLEVSRASIRRSLPADS